MNLKFTGKYKSLTEFELNNLPSLTIITGLNGTGKSQLLSIIRNSYYSTSKNHAYNLEISDIAKERNGVLYWSAGGLNLGFGNKSFGYDDLKFIIQYLKAKISGNSLTLSDLMQDDNDFDPNSHQYAKNQLKHHLLRKSDKIIDELEKRVGKSREKISGPDISYHFPEEILLEDLDLFNQDSLEMIFFMYLYKKTAIERESIEVNLPDDSPWDVLNNIMDRLGLDYEIIEPKLELVEPIFQNAFYDVLSERFKLSIKSKTSGEEISFSDISSGEKVLLSLGLLIYYSQNRNQSRKLLLLDEPEAHLHPSLTKHFFQVIHDFFIREYGGKVVMTTHSPSTIALSPENDYCKIFCIEKNPTMIYNVQKAKAISILSSGLLLISDNTKYVVSEGKNDKPFYTKIYNTLTNNNLINNYPSIVFIPAKGKDSVEHWVKEIRETDQVNYYGIIDKDQNNIESSYVYAIKRYSIENYLLDPVIVYVTTSKEIESLKHYNIKRGNEFNVRNLESSDLQKISDEIIKEVTPLIEDLDEQSKESVKINYIDSREIIVPKWFTDKKGKFLLQKFQSIYGGASAINHQSLITNIQRTNLISEDFKILFQKIIDN